MSTLYGRLKGTPDALRALSIGRLKYSAVKLLHAALQQSGLDSKTELARKLGVRKSAVNAVLNGDGNVQISTLADYLHAMGFEAELKLVPAGKPREDAVRAMHRAKARSRNVLNLVVNTQSDEAMPPSGGGDHTRAPTELPWRRLVPAVYTSTRSTPFVVFAKDEDIRSERSTTGWIFEKR